MIADLLPNFFPQCCDAALYLLQGLQCATDNSCYDQLRPMGAQLWFSLPYRVGLPADILILVHWLLFATSVLLARCALISVLRRWQPGLVLSRTTRVLLLVLSAIIHGWFFWPVMQVALADAPAGLFILIACWLLLLDTRSWHIAVAGLLLGCAAWLRFAYLYPLLGMLAGVMMWWCFDRNRDRKQVWLLLALLPVLIQYAATYQHFGIVQYLGPKAYDDLESEHGLSVAAGQETILPQQQYLWPTTCRRQIGMDQALHDRDIGTLTCLLMSRFYFSFGSYAPQTYVFGATNLLTHSAIEHVGLDSKWHHWHSRGITRMPDTQTAPDGSAMNQKLVVTPLPGPAEYFTAMTKRVPAGKAYTFSVWLWSAQPRTIDLLLRTPQPANELARQTVTMTALPTRFAVTGTLPAAPWYASSFEDLEVVIGSTPAHDVSFDDVLPAEFHAWGAQLEQSGTMTTYRGSQSADVDLSFRQWSRVYFFAQLAAIFIFVLALWHTRQQATATRAGMVLLLALVVAEVLVTQPEQRFVIVPEIIVWLSAAVSVIARWARRDH